MTVAQADEDGVEVVGDGGRVRMRDRGPGLVCPWSHPAAGFDQVGQFFGFPRRAGVGVGVQERRILPQRVLEELGVLLDGDEGQLLAVKEIPGVKSDVTLHRPRLPPTVPPPGRHVPGAPQAGKLPLPNPIFLHAETLPLQLPDHVAGTRPGTDARIAPLLQHARIREQQIREPVQLRGFDVAESLLRGRHPAPAGSGVVEGGWGPGRARGAG